MKSGVRGRFHPAGDLQIESYLCGELDDAERAHLEQQIERDPALASYVRERGEAAASFARKHPLRLPARTDSVWARRRGALTLPALGIAASLALAGVWWSEPNAGGPPSPARTSSAAQQDRVRVKGSGIEVALYVKRGDEVFQHEPRTALRPGDRLRLRVDDAQGGYLSVLAQTRSGEIAVYYDRLPVSPGRFLVPDSLLLDARFQAERWLVVVDGEALPAERHASAWREGKLPAARYRLLELARGAP